MGSPHSMHAAANSGTQTRESPRDADYHPGSNQPTFEHDSGLA